MKHGMLEVDNEVEAQNTEDDFHPGREHNIIQDAPTVGFNEESHPDGLKGDDQAHCQGIQKNDAQVAEPTGGLGSC
jgi:hypothetical protein